MKIWIDITNSPHVNFFSMIIRDLSRLHDIIITCRPLANTIELMKIEGLDYHMIGKHYGRNKFKKVFGFWVRTGQLYKFLRKRSIDVAVSHSSYYSPLVAKMLGCRNIYINDNEHARANWLAFLFADWIMVPEFINLDNMIKQKTIMKKIIKYPGIKEGVYLWACKPELFNIDICDDSGKKKKIFVRPEPWAAHYYSGKQSFIDHLLISLKNQFDLIILPRSEAQKQHYSMEKFRGITVMNNSISLCEIMGICDLFIGAGGTMTREAAVLGIPTISIYQDALLGVDEFLINNKYMQHVKNIDYEFVANFIKNNEKDFPHKKLLDKGEKTFNLIKQVILDATFSQP